MIKLKFVVVVLAVTLLTSCGNQIGPINSTNSNQVSALGNTSIGGNGNLEKINSAIDFATGTRNTTNNYNLKFYVDGPEAFPEMENMILNAKESIYIEVFKFYNDYTGKKIADGLIAKAKEGLDVRLLYDYVGNKDTKYIDYMAKNGVKVETYNRQVFTPKGMNITHRKLYVVDGRRIMTGGMNIADKYAYAGIHDTLMSYEGEAVKETLKEFYFDWKRAGGEISASMKATLEKPLQPNDLKKIPLRVTVTSPNEPDKKIDIKRMMVAAIDSAKDNIKIAMPYFSDDELVEKLILAQKRGVKVTTLIPKINDEKIFDKLNLTTVNQLIEGNVEVFLSGAKTQKFNHSKVLLVDNIWATMGSCNADNRAFTINQELNISISDTEFAQEVNKRFFDYHIQNSEKAVYVKLAWYKKPLYTFLEGVEQLF